MKNFLRIVFFALVILFCVGFSVSNSQSIQLTLFRISLRPLPVALLVLAPFFIGLVLGNILDLAERVSLRREVKRLTKELEEHKEQPLSSAQG